MKTSQQQYPVKALTFNLKRSAGWHKGRYTEEVIVMNDREFAVW